MINRHCTPKKILQISQIDFYTFRLRKTSITILGTVRVSACQFFFPIAVVSCNNLKRTVRFNFCFRLRFQVLLRTTLVVLSSYFPAHIFRAYCFSNCRIHNDENGDGIRTSQEKSLIWKESNYEVGFANSSKESVEKKKVSYTVARVEPLKVTNSSLDDLLLLII